MIPPSILFIIYGVIAVVPIGDLFLGGAVAGLLSAAAYIIVILLRTILAPRLAPRTAERFTLAQRLRVLVEVGPVLLLVVLVFSGLFAGFFTPTEAGAVGATLCALIAVARRKLTRRAIVASVVETLATTAAIFVIAIGANLLARFIAVSQAGDLNSTVIVAAGTSKVLLLAGIVVLYLILGIFLDPLGAMLLTLPIILPVVRAAGSIWCGSGLSSPSCSRSG